MRWHIISHLNGILFWRIRYYAPNFEEVEGAYWFGPVRLTVCQSDRLSVRPLRLMLVVKLENRLS